MPALPVGLIDRCTRVRSALPIGRRRWLVRARRRDDTDLVVDVQVPENTDGLVLVRVNDAVVVLQPHEVSRLRAALLQAQAVALQDRGRW